MGAPPTNPELNTRPHHPIQPEQHRCFIVATCDKDLKRRLRKIPGVPIMYVANRKYSIERMPEAFGAPRL